MCAHLLQLKVIEELVLGYLESLKSCGRFHASGMKMTTFMATVKLCTGRLKIETKCIVSTTDRDFSIKTSRITG